MRIAIVSPYSWSYPGGVARHIEALAASHRQAGHEVRIITPVDPPGPRSTRLHGGTAPQERQLDGHIVDLGRTVGIPANGAVSNLSLSPAAVQRLGEALAEGNFDVVHVHEPVVPLISWMALNCSSTALVATYHTYATNRLTQGIANLFGARRRMRRLHARIAVSEAATWTARRFYGGRYSVIANGVELPVGGPPTKALGSAGKLKLVFVGQAVDRKGLPVLLSAFEGLREHIDAELTIIGATADDVEPLLVDSRGVTVAGLIDDAEKQRLLAEADLLVAPSLGGESFGMVLTEAFAAGTPVVASEIAGYRDVVDDGANGVLVPHGDPLALAETLRDLALEPARRAELNSGAAASAAQYSWPVISEQTTRIYEQAIAAHASAQAAAGQRQLSPAEKLDADGLPAVPAQRLETIEPEPAGGWRRARLRSAVRHVALLVAVSLTVCLAIVALEKIGVDRVIASLLQSSPAWVLAAVAVMCLSMVLRAVSWHAILHAALPDRVLTQLDTLRATAIGVLMSSTLPARLGEPARAIVISRRAGRPRETMPTVVGTLVSQTVLNVIALLVLAAIALSSVPIFNQRHGALLAVVFIPVVLLVIVLVVPAVLAASGSERFGRTRAVIRPLLKAARQVRSGLRVFTRPRDGLLALAAQLSAWALQALACYLLLAAIGLDGRAGIGAAAAVLLAVNVTALVPATPANVGVFQAACVAVLTGAYGVSAADALAYGIVLQAVEVATAVLMGVPALLGEGLSWRDVRLRALHSTPVRLGPAADRSAGNAKPSSISA
ncbi:MAG: lysylphosphatidylglycerol synthase domain-containing protein [Solirubrobacteraceae bacterium]|jgi:phosphatidyl-myo-inositol alpha-mannosyltransferase|nr:lysylphosphatidylglycerol synthase domain-containing protein [Solirubrobacteraceae bacterium]MDP4673338.1 lysylphosphatidylglycerol synthase domain-containing protein [Solirubrobacteraceae bacterium]MDP4921439.1 lysylphosphatidylglycerol synthase domain-containing protein [Solirubrobacteraceae bacterium]